MDEEEDHWDLRRALNSAVLDICSEEDADEDTATYTTSLAVAALSELLFQYATTSLATDLRHFCKHANRRTITADDVKLVLRKNPSLYDRLTEHCRQDNTSHNQSTVSLVNSSKQQSRARSNNRTKSSLEKRTNITAMDTSDDDSDEDYTNLLAGPSNRPSKVDKAKKQQIPAKRSAPSLTNKRTDLTDDSSSSDDDILFVASAKKPSNKENKLMSLFKLPPPQDSTDDDSMQDTTSKPKSRPSTKASNPEPAKPISKASQIMAEMSMDSDSDFG